MSPDSPSPEHRQRVMLVTGLSGAGKTTTLNVLEDLGWEALDNFPIRLLERLVATEAGHDEPRPPLAIGFDSRTRGFVPSQIIARWKKLAARPDLDVTTLFLDCSGAELERRYNETRRRHPMAQGRPVMEGIKAERELMDPLRRWAEAVIDTSALTSSDLQQAIRERFGDAPAESMTVTVSSFGFARGMPPLADSTSRYPRISSATRPGTRPSPASATSCSSCSRATPRRGRPTSTSRSVVPAGNIARSTRRRPSRGPCATRGFRPLWSIATWVRAPQTSSKGSRSRDEPDPSGRLGSGRRRATAEHEHHLHMIGLILVTHGRLAEEFVSAMEHVVGPQERIATICIGPSDDMEKRRAEIARAIGKVDTGAGAIILTDLFGGTPSNLAISLLEAGRVEVIAGINLPMLIRLAGARKAMGVSDAVKAARDAGKSYITIASEFLSAEACLKKKAAQ